MKIRVCVCVCVCEGNSCNSLFVYPDSLWPGCLVMEVLWTVCERTECAAECLYQPAVIETLLAPVIALLNGQQVSHTHTHT